MDIGNAASLIQQSVAQNNAWSAQQAQKQMDFQERMSNTAHQREIADLKASGLNPVLSAKLGGASTPSGAMGDTDTSGTSALVDLLEMAMETASSAAGAARAAAGNTSTVLDPAASWLESNGYSAYHMSNEDSQKIYSWLGDGSGMKSAVNSSVSTIGNFVGKIFGKDAGNATKLALGSVASSIQYDPVKRGESTVNRYNANAVGSLRLWNSAKDAVKSWVNKHVSVRGSNAWLK